MWQSRGELATSRLNGGSKGGMPRHADHASVESGRRDSNPQHSAWKADALPLSYAREQRQIVTRDRFF